MQPAELSSSAPLHRQSRSLWILLAVSCIWSLFHWAASLRYDHAIAATLILPENGLPSHRSVVVGDPDSLQWIMHSQQSAKDGRIRLPRWTTTDNHPYGRPLLWPSPHSWWLRGLGTVHSWVTGDTLDTSIAKASSLSNPTYLLLFTLPITFIALRTFGMNGFFTIPILLLLLGGGKYGVRSPDHHVLHIVLTMLFLLSVLRLNLHKHRRDWIYSGLLLGFLFWTSALSAIIILLASLIPIPLILSHPSTTLRKNWFIWSGCASFIIIASYLLDYAPHWSIHLECPNPIYAALLLAGTPLIPEWIRFCRSRASFISLQWRWIIYPGLLLAALALIILFNLPTWYTLSDAFVARWVSMIQESQAGSLPSLFDANALLPLFLLALLIAVVRWPFHRLGNAPMFLLAYCGIILLFYLQQTRVSDFIWPGIALLTVSLLRLELRNWASSLILSLLLLLQIHQTQTLNGLTRDLEHFADVKALPINLQRSYNYALDSASIRQSMGGGSASILALPSDSVYLGYYTDFPVFGTFYWENKQGMFRAMRMLFHQQESESGTFPNIQEFLTAAKVDTLYLHKDGVNSRLRYIPYINFIIR